MVECKKQEEAYQQNLPVRRDSNMINSLANPVDRTSMVPLR